MNRALGLTTLWIGALLCAAPFLLLITTSLMTYEQAMAYPPAFWPSPLTLDNFRKAMGEGALWRWFGNSVLVAVLTVAGQILTGAMAGYAFARMSFRGRDVLFFIVLMTMMVPVQVNLVPLFALVARLGWVDTYQALIIPDLAGAFGIFLFRQWFMGLPKELEDAARLDGCSPWRFFWTVALPTATPAVATLGIFQFLASWNTFMWPLVATHADHLRTLPVGLAAFRASMRETTDWPLLMAATTVAIVPAIIVFLFLQKQFMKGLMDGAVKG